MTVLKIEINFFLNWKIVNKILHINIYMYKEFFYSKIWNI
jgi:hypothetical protein